MNQDDRSAQAGPAVGSPVDRGVGRLEPERSVRHLLTPDMIAAEDAAGGVVAAGALVPHCPEGHGPMAAYFDRRRCNYCGAVSEPPNVLVRRGQRP